MTTATTTAAAASGANEQAKDGLYKKVFWRIMPFLMLCYVIAYLDRVNVGFAKLQMSADLGFSETVFGLGAGLFFIGYFLFEVPSNILMHKVGARIWIARIMITWGILSAVFMFVQNATQFYILRFLLGLAEAGFYPGIILYLTYWFPSHRRAKVIAVFMSGIPVAGILGNPLSGWIMDAFHQNGGLEGWQWMFLIEAIPAVLIGLVTLLYLDNDVKSAKWLSDDEKKMLQADIDGDQKGKESGHGFGAIVKDGRVWLMCLIYFAFVMGQYGLTLWMPTLVKATGVVGNLQIGLLSAIPFGCAIVAMNLIGRSADRMRERRWHLVVPAMMGCVGFIGAAMFADNTAISIAALSLAAAGVLTCAPL
ncbi:MFS transporter, partial [Herbaspirillum sp.]